MNVLKFIAILVVLFGVILIYDARPITKKNFGFGDQNDASLGLKIIGFILTIIGGVVYMI